VAAGAVYLGGLRQHRIRAETLVRNGSADTVADPAQRRLAGRADPGRGTGDLSRRGSPAFRQHPDQFVDVVTDFLRRPPARQLIPATA
jgi:hypothetical protein